MELRQPEMVYLTNTRLDILDGPGLELGDCWPGVDRGMPELAVT